MEESNKGDPTTVGPRAPVVTTELIDGRYRVQKRLGGGTFGTVYRCFDETLNLEVAVKIANERISASETGRDSFLTEARMLATIDHPLVMKVRDFRQAPAGVCYAVFDLVDGSPLSECLTTLRQNRPALVRLLAGVAEALQVVHESGLVHRDVKPGNIMVRLDGRPCLVDFGLAIADELRRKHQGEFAGTPTYMAPEQVRGEAHRLDGRTDIWALGVVLYESLAGKPPFGGVGLDVDTLIDEILHREPPPLRTIDPSIPRLLEEIVMNCLRKPLAQRTASAADLAQQLMSRKLADALAEAAAKSRPRPKTRWTSDARFIDVEFLRDIVFETPLIKSFLDSDHQYFVSANKGLGKTLLLKLKRTLLAEEYSHHPGGEGRPSVQFIPEGRPYLDMMSTDMTSLSNQHLTLLSSFRNCKRMWSFSIRASVISHFSDLTEDFRESISRKRKHAVPEWVGRKNLIPSEVFKAILTMPFKSINSMLDDYEGQLDYLFRRSHSGVYVFIDRVEQGFPDLPRDAWIHVQAGLIEAAWDLMSANSHVKIYASIREEAYANYESDIRANYHTATVALRYSEEDLRQLIDKLAGFYEASADFQEFVGRSEVLNQHSQVTEDSFCYLHRHTVGRPRDLVIICSEVSLRRGQLTEPMYREIVNDVSSQSIARSVFDEMGPLIDCLDGKPERQRLYSLLPSNILSFDDLKTVCCRFNGVDGADFDDLQAAGQILHHPFCELYNCGLLGIVRQNPHSGAPIQYFKQPQDVLGSPGTCLPRSEHYLIHPALQSLIHQQHAGVGYQTFQFVTVGHRYDWRRYYSSVIAVQRALTTIREFDLSEDVMHVLQLANSALRTSGDGRIDHRPNFSATVTALREVQRRLERRNYDELYLTLDELASRHLLDRNSGVET